MNISKISAFIAFILSVIFLSIFVKWHITIWLLLCVWVFAFFIARLAKVKIYHCIEKITKNESITIFIGIVLPISLLLFSAIITLLFSLDPPLYEQSNRLYFPKDSIEFEKEIKISSKNFHKLIFAFDNSGEGLKDPITGKENLQEQYETYCNEIESSKLFSWADNEKVKIKQFRKNNTYGNLLKARLCFDLINRANDKGEFIILKIGDPNAQYDSGDFKSFETKNIEKAIQTIISKTNNESHTNYHTFFADLENQKNRKKETEQIILFTYSDFYHDHIGTETDDELEKIKRNKRRIIKDMVHNCFIDNHKSKRGGKYILDSEPDFAYERFFFIDSINENEDISTKVVISNEYWFYSQEHKKQINTTLRLIFSNYGKSIRSYNAINIKGKNKKKFQLNDEIFDRGEIKYFGDNDTVIKLQYEGKTLPDEETTLFEIIHNDVHYFVYFDFIKEWEKNCRYWFPLIAFFIGSFIGLWNFKKK